MAAKWLQLGMVLGVFALSGCALVPGSNIDLGDKSPPDHAKVNLDGKLNIYAITPELESRLLAPPVPPRPNADLDNSLKSYDYQVGPGDVLAITVWEHPELLNPAAGSALDAMSSTSSSSDRSGGGGTVNPMMPIPGHVVAGDGTLYFPYVGMIKVDGLNVRQIRVLLGEKLSRYIPDPQIDVSVASFHARRVYVTGEVKAPGALPITNIPMTLLDAVNQVGGILPTANWEHVTLTRGGREYDYSMRDLYKWGDVQQNILLQANDVVWVPPAVSSVVFVFGEVLKQQSVPIQQTGLTLADALAQSGGMNQLTANASGVFVLRKAKDNGDGKLIDVYQLNVKDAEALVLADAFPLQPRDIVYITAAPLARWNRVVSLLLPEMQFIYLETQARQSAFNTK
jgi:polysaccharide export outer membrane protein